METMNQYEVDLWEDEIEWDVSGKIVHHPLNSRYFVKLGNDIVSYGHLTFAGHDLDKSPILDDVKVYYLEFKGDPEGNDDREEWADTLRVDVLKRLTSNDRCWYMSIIDRWFRGVSETISQIVGTRLNQINVRSEKPYGTTYGFRTREFFEIPNDHLNKIVPYLWSKAVPGYPIEGYNLKTGQLEILRQWNARPRDDRLFRDVIDQTFINFYTFPAEHRYFVFVTNKLNFTELADLIGLEELQARAKEMSGG